MVLRFVYSSMYFFPCCSFMHFDRIFTSRGTARTRRPASRGQSGALGTILRFVRCLCIDVPLHSTSSSKPCAVGVLLEIIASPRPPNWKCGDHFLLCTHLIPILRYSSSLSDHFPSKGQLRTIPMHRSSCTATCRAAVHHPVRVLWLELEPCTLPRRFRLLAPKSACDQTRDIDGACPVSLSLSMGSASAGGADSHPRTPAERYRGHGEDGGDEGYLTLTPSPSTSLLSWRARVRRGHSSTLPPTPEVVPLSLCR
ncbi:hypothetical protein C8R45DRAFT_398549 [Mycena sanguinolenta]|nr:hypothetical protein C8R45DRAFT_398549 [Mycena sanguinolenta]